MVADPDVELMLRVKAGEIGAFQTLYNKHKNRILSFCYRYSGHRGISEELAQEVFLRVFKAAPRYRPKARFTTWLYRIATNVCLNELRKREYRQKIKSLDNTGENFYLDTPADGDTPSPETHLEERERNRLIKQTLYELPGKQRMALLLRIEGGFRYKEIAHQMGCTENQVKVLIFRGRQNLKKRLTHILGENNDGKMPK